MFTADVLDIWNGSFVDGAQLTGGSDLAWLVTVLPNADDEVNITLPRRDCFEAGVACVGERSLEDSFGADVDYQAPPQQEDDSPDANVILSGVMTWGAGDGGAGGAFVGYARRKRMGEPDRAGGFEIRYIDRAAVRSTWDLYALAQLQGTVLSGPAAGLTFPVVMTMSDAVDLSSGFVFYAGGHSFASGASVNPEGDGGDPRYWMWDAPCARWQAGDEVEFRLMAPSPGVSAQDAHADASLESLSVAGATLDSPFDPGVLDYAATADPDTGRVTVGAVAAQPDACVSQIVPSDADGDPSNGHQVDLVDADTVVSVVVTAADNSTVGTYTLTVSIPVAPVSDDATLRGLVIDGAVLGGVFDAAVSGYTAQAEAHIARVTVAAEPADDGAVVEIVPSDADGDPSNGHQVDLVAAQTVGGVGRTQVEVSVTAGDGVSRAVYSVVVLRVGAAGFGRAAGRDVDMRGSAVAVPSGMWSDGSSVWVGDLVYDGSSGADTSIYRVAAVDAVSGGLVAGSELLLRDVLGAHERAVDVWSDGETLWVLAADGRVVAFGLADGQRRAGSDIRSLRYVRGYFGLWSDGEILWVGRNSDATSAGSTPGASVLAMDLASGRRLPGRDITVVSAPAGASSAHGLWSDGITMWVMYGDAGTALAFDLDSGQRRPNMDLGFAGRDGIGVPRALWSDGAVMWVGDYPTSYSYATHTFAALSRLVAYYLPTEAALGSLGLVDVGGEEVSIGRFSAWDTHYRGDVFSDVDTVTVDAGVYHPDAAATITPADADADTAGHQVALDVGVNAVTVLVGTPNHTVAYTIEILRLPPLALTSLEFSDTILTPRFAAGTSNYTGAATALAERVTVTAVPNDPGAVVEITPPDADADTAGHQVDLDIGVNTATVTVTAADGVTVRVYEVAVTRPPPPALTALEFSDTTLAPRFAAGTSNYTGAVVGGTSRITVVAEADNPGATITTVPADSAPGVVGHQIDVGEGDLVVTVTVTAADGATSRDYSVMVGRDRQPAAVARVVLGGVDVDFSPMRGRYDASAPQDLTSTTIDLAPAGRSTLGGFAVTAGDAQVTPIGDGGRVGLSPGRDTLIAVRASSPGHQRERLYTFRLRAPQNGNGARSIAPGGSLTLGTSVKSVLPALRADNQDGNEPLLTALSVSSGTLAPSFESAVLDYNLSVPFDTEHLTVTPTAATGATVTYSDPDADADTGGQQFALNPIQNGQPSQTAIAVIVTHGTNVNSYTITVTRNPASTSEQSGSDFAGDTTTVGRLGINEYLKGEIDTGGDQDWYAVNLKGGYDYFFYMLGSGGDHYGTTGSLSKPWITGIYKSDGSEAATPFHPYNCHNPDGYSNSSPDLFAQIVGLHGHRIVRCGPSFWSTPGTVVYFVPEADGMYYIGVASKSTTSTGTYTLIQRTRAYSDPVPDHYYYGTHPQAYGRATVGEPAAGFIQHPMDLDYFAVELTAGRRYRVDGRNATDVMGRSVRIEPGHPSRVAYFAVGSIWRMSTNGSGGYDYHHVSVGSMCDFKEFTAPVTGTYLVRVGAWRTRNYSAATGWGGYKVAVTDITDD